MKRKGLFALLTLGFALILTSCTKLNEPTELGGDLLPAVDNVNTFDTTFIVETAYHPFLDSTLTEMSDNLALGQLHDPVFGNTSADMYFNLSSPTYGSSPFVSKDSVVGIDSVVLTLTYVGAYGDSTAGSQISAAVSEITTDSDFQDKKLYRFDQTGFTTGPALGTKTFSIPKFADTVTVIRSDDTAKLVNVLRIHLDNALGEKLKNFDTSANSPYKHDSLFRKAFRGLAVKATNAAGLGTLAYFNLTAANSGLTVYFRVKKAGAIDTTSTTFVHSGEVTGYNSGQADSVIRTPGGDFMANMGVASPQKLYIQSSPTGSYAGIKIPQLSSLPNKVIHRAELIVYRVPSVSDNVFSAPNRLLLDRKSAGDTAYYFDKDIQTDASGSFNLALFGGTLRSDNSYRFNVTRYVQGIVTNKEPNDSLRLYAPLRSVLRSQALGQYVSFPILSNVANGRVVLAGPNYPDEGMKMRLRIIYSNL